MDRQSILSALLMTLLCFSLTACGGGGGGDTGDTNGQEDVSGQDNDNDGNDNNGNNDGGNDNTIPDVDNGGGDDDEAVTDEDDEISNQEDNDNSTAFPSNIAVSSPTLVSVDVAQASLTFGSSPAVAEAVSQEVTYDYELRTATLDDLLASALDLGDALDFDEFFDSTIDADCYGPDIAFDFHPDTPDGAPEDSDSGELPEGDLGLWTEVEGSSTEACAAAQLNQRMEGVNNKSSIALMMLASMVSVYEDGGANNWPEDVAAGSTLDLVAGMSALSISNATFNVATMALNADGDQWTYRLELTYSLDGDDHDIVFNLEHVPGSDEDEYEGLLTFLVNDSFSGGNCGGGDNDITVNGSLHYIHNSETDVVLQYRETQYCGHDVNGLQTAITSDNLSGNMVSASPTGSLVANWADNFTVFTADFNPTTLGGSYAYAWQAGFNDSHSRVLNVGLEATTSGEAYFGFGEQVYAESFDGGAQGFICNWAGPGNDHTLQDYVQRQHITLDTEEGVYTPTGHGGDNDSSDLIYAPTNSCMYDRTDGDFVEGDPFAYDRNLDLIIDANDISDVVETVIDADQQLEFGLRGIPVESSAENIWEYISNDRGYTLPAYPN